MSKYSQNTDKPICIIVAFYKNPQLVTPFIDAIFKQQQDLLLMGARLCIINDSPEDQSLSQELNKIGDLSWQISIDYRINEKNIGYLQSVNNALESSIANNEDVLLINSDAILFSGALREIVQVAYSDPMIGFVSPRTNNATLCSFPHDAQSLNEPPQIAFERFKKASKYLPRITYSPTVVGFCLFIKHSLLVEFGIFDPIYGKGYNEENDLIFRANRYGYRAVIANYAYAWHGAEQSFSLIPGGREKLEKKNAQILNLRYPEYDPLIKQYYASVSYQAESLISALYPPHADRRVFVFDCLHMSTYHNGTMRLIKEVLQAIDQHWPNNCELQVLMSKEAWDFHGLNKSQRLQRIDLDANPRPCAVAIRIGQPFFAEELVRLYQRAPVVGIFMLDTIAWDCGYLKTGWDESVWSNTLEFSDLIFTSSAFTKKQLEMRFSPGPNTEVISILHSVALDDYSPSINTSLSPLIHQTLIEEDGVELSSKVHMLIVGNKFHHKDVGRTTKMLASQLPDIDISVLSASDDLPQSVKHIPTGDLTNIDLEKLYESAHAIIFPSHYEGFGFPVLHALAHQKPIFLRRLPVYEEIKAHLTEGAMNLHYFESLDDLVQQLKSEVPRWHGPAAQSTDQGWEQTANSLWSSIQQRLDKVELPLLTKRLRWCLLLQQPIDEQARTNRTLIENLEQKVRRLEDELGLITQTWSWKSTSGLRWIRRQVDRYKARLSSLLP